MIAGGYTIQYIEDYHIPLWQFLPVQTIQMEYTHPPSKLPHINPFAKVYREKGDYGSYGDGTNTVHASWNKEIIDVATDHYALVPIIAPHFEDI